MGKNEHENIELIGGTFEDKGDEIQNRFNEYDKKTREGIMNEFLTGERVKNVLDLGCSIGAWGDYLARKGFKEIIGIDISKNRVERCKSRGCYTKVKVMDAKKLNFRNNYFSLVVHIDVLVHILQKKDRERVFKEVSRVLKKDGVFIFSIANRKYENNLKALSPLVGKKYEVEQYCNPMTLEEAKELANKNNLHIEKITAFEFAYPKRLIKYPRVLSLFDFLGKGPLKEHGAVIFIKARCKK